jgi:hypothetical protein
MRGMEVHLNGNRLCTAGIRTDSALNAVVEVVGRNSDYDMLLRVGGLEDDEFVIWAEQGIQVGDQINIRIVDTESIDMPEKRNPNPTP